MPDRLFARIAVRIHSLAVVTALGLTLVAGGYAGSVTAAEDGANLRFDIPAQSLETALLAFSEQAGMQIVVANDVAKGLSSPGVQGQYQPTQALSLLLQGSGLSYRVTDERTIAVHLGDGRSAAVEAGEGVRLAQVEGGAEASGSGSEVGEAAQGEERGEDGKEQTVGKSENGEDAERGGMPEVLVTGSKVLNTDIRRTENDIQPYVVFERERIEQSAAANLEEFFRKELTISASTMVAAQLDARGNRSSINLRGLGEDETLILIDGRRVAGFNFNGSPRQPDINGIPLAAIERVEVLPTTASGIFGGGATGGVINVVLRRDYAGLETRLTYGNTFASDAMSRRVDLNAGFNLEGGKTNVLLAGSYSEARPLLTGERNFVDRGRQHILDANGGDLQALNQFGVLPPLGATTNIRSVTGGNLVLDPEHGGEDIGAPITHVPRGYAGVAATLDHGAALAANAGQYNLALADTAQQQGRRYGLLSSPQTKSLMMTLRREFAPSVQAFLEMQASESSTEFAINLADATNVLPSDAPTNPFQQPIFVIVPTVGLDEAIASESEDRRATAGLLVHLAQDWRAGVDITWSRSQSSYTWSRTLSPDTGAAIRSGSLDVLRDVNEFPLPWELHTRTAQSPADMELKGAALRLGGALPWSMPGGSPAVSSIIERREESLGEVVTFCGGCGDSATLYPERSQSVDSAYLEMRVPVVSAQNRRPGVDLLDLQVAVRYDDYSVTGTNTEIRLDDPSPIERFTNRTSSVDPTLGLRYQPTRDVMLRASYGTGFLPPSMTQLAPEPPQPTNYVFYGLVDPLRDDEPIEILDTVVGGNPDLQPEESESTSLGLILTPRRLPGLRFAVDWSRIEKTDNIQFAFVNSQAALETLINFFPERVIRGAPSDGFSAGPITGLNSTLINIARTRVEALDLSFDYELEAGVIGAFKFSAEATRLLTFETQAAPTAQVEKALGTVSFLASAIKWNAKASIEWQYLDWALGWKARFFDSYFFDSARTVDPQQGAAGISSQIYHDLYGRYRFSSQPTSLFGMLADVEIWFGVNNVFDKEPPVDVVRGVNSMYSLFGDPRLANYYITIGKTFSN